MERAAEKWEPVFSCSARDLKARATEKWEPVFSCSACDQQGKV